MTNFSCVLKNFHDFSANFSFLILLLCWLWKITSQSRRTFFFLLFTSTNFSWVFWKYFSLLLDKTAFFFVFKFHCFLLKLQNYKTDIYSSHPLITSARRSLTIEEWKLKNIFCWFPRAKSAVFSLSNIFRAQISVVWVRRTAKWKYRFSRLCLVNVFVYIWHSHVASKRERKIFWERKNLKLSVKSSLFSRSFCCKEIRNCIDLHLNLQ